MVRPIDIVPLGRNEITAPEGSRGSDYGTGRGLAHTNPALALRNPRRETEFVLIHTPVQIRKDARR